MNEHISKSQFIELRELYFDGTLTAEQREQFNAYLDTHPELKSALERESRYLNSMGMLETPRLSATETDFVNAVLDAWDAEKDQSIPPTFTIKRYFQPLAFAAAALLIGITFWMLNPGTDTDSPEVVEVNVDITPREAKNPLSILLRETHEQYASQQDRLNQTVAAPASMLNLGSVINSLITPTLPEPEKTPG